MGVIVGEDEYWYYTANGGMSPRPKDWRTGNPLPLSGRYPRPGQSAGTVSQPSVTNTANVGVTNNVPQTTYQNPNALVDARNAAASMRTPQYTNPYLLPEGERNPHPGMTTMDMVTGPDGRSYSRHELWRLYNDPAYRYTPPRPPQMMQYMQLPPEYFNRGFVQRQPTMQFFGSAQQPAQAFGLLPPFQTVGFWNRNF